MNSCTHGTDQRKGSFEGRHGGKRKVTPEEVLMRIPAEESGRQDKEKLDQTSQGNKRDNNSQRVYCYLTPRNFRKFPSLEVESVLEELALLQKWENMLIPAENIGLKDSC